MDDRLIQELRATRHQLNAHLLELRDELSRVRASMQRAAPPQLVVQDELGRYSDGRPVANQLAVGQGSSPRRLPSPMGSPTLLPSPTSPRAASTLHLPPGPRFPLNPTAGRSGTPSTSSPPPPSSALADLLELVQDERAPAGRAFEPARATRGSVRLLSRGPDGSQAAGPSNGSTADAWVIPIYPFSEARAEAIMVAQPAQGPSVETRIAGSVPEATGPGSSTTRRTSETRTRFPQSGSAAVSLLFGSGARDGPWGDDPESDARRNVGDLRAAFLPRTVNVPPISSERGQANSTVGSDDGSAAVSGSNRLRPRPTPPPGASSYASGSRPPQRQPSLTAGELDPNGETFDRLQSALPAHTASGARQTPIEPSVWTLLPVRPPLLSSSPPFPIDTVSPSSAPAFGAPSFDRDSSEAQRRFDRTSGLLEDLQQRRERLRFNIAALRGSGSRDLPGVDDSSSVSDDPQPTVAPGNLRPPEQSTPVSSPALQHRSVSARLLEALGGEGLGDIGRRLAREERENAIAGSQWDGWASFTGTSSWDDADGPPATGGIRSSPPTVPTDADLRNAPRRTRSVLRAYLQQGSAPSADLEARLLRAEQEDAARATRLPPSQEAGGSRLPAGSRRNAPWLLGDGGSQTSTTETRSGDEARFWPGVYGGGTLIMDVPRAQMQSLLDASRGSREPPEEPVAGPAAGPPYPWRLPSTSDSRAPPRTISPTEPPPPPLGLRPSWIDQDGNWLPSRPAQAQSASQERPRPSPLRSSLKRDAAGEEVWFERPGPVALPASLQGGAPYAVAWQVVAPPAPDVRPAPGGRSSRVGR